MAKNNRNGLPSAKALLDLALQIPRVNDYSKSQELKDAEKAVTERRSVLLRDSKYRQLIKQEQTIRRRDEAAKKRQNDRRAKLIQKIRLEGTTSANVAAVKKALGL